MADLNPTASRLQQTTAELSAEVNRFRLIMQADDVPLHLKRAARDLFERLTDWTQALHEGLEQEKGS